MSFSVIQNVLQQRISLAIFDFGLEFVLSLLKKLMKKTVLVLLLAAIYFSGNAQRKARYATAASRSGVSIGVEAGLPLGENGKPYSFIIGGSLQYEMRPDAELGLT